MYKDNRKTLKQSTYPDLDKALSEWFRKVRSINVPVNGPLLGEKARYFADQLGYENFKASSGFLDRFKERQCISSQVISGKKKSVDPNVVETWSERLPDICRGYDPRDRFNADETDLLWKATPTQTLNFKGQKCSGVGGLGSIVKSVSLSWWLVTRMVQKSYPCYLSENMLNPGASEEVIWICLQSSTAQNPFCFF